MWQFLGRACVVLAGVVLAASFAGDLHGFGDSLAVFRPVLIGGSLCVVALVWRWRVAQALGAVALVLGGFHVVQVVPLTTETDTADLIIYQKNMLFLPRDRSDLMADIRAQGADIVALQEISRTNQPTLEALRDVYPYQLLCNDHSVGPVAILSRTALEGQDCSDHHGFARALTEVDGVTVQVFALHLNWPWPYSQQEHLQDVLENMAAQANGPTIVAGDFNMVAAGRTVAWLEQATQTQRVGRLVRTFEVFGYPIGIDHILATGGQGTLSVRPQYGSDHYGLVGRIDWPETP